MPFRGSRLPISLRALVPLAASCLLAGLGGGVARGQEARKVRCGGAEYEYVLFPPARQTARPAVLLLHGAGEGPSGIVSLWRALARREDIALIAPRLPVELRFEAIAPAVLRCVVEDAGRRVRIDRRRVYVFGHSMGGYLAYDAAIFDSDLFAAAGVHAAAIADEYAGMAARPGRRIPIAIYIGDRDASVPLEGVRRTRDLLEANGFPVHYVELAGHDHRYALDAERINADAWRFFEQQPPLASAEGGLRPAPYTASLFP